MNPSSDDGLATGTRIGPYEILSALGAGGMGRVYLARDMKLDRQVAIKTLPPEFAQDADRLARFQREAKFLAALNHANIAGIYGLEASGKAEYLVLEYVPGESLADRLERGPLPLEESLEVCRQVALALEAAHEAGVIHRDLKPGNVMVTPDGTAKVLDFGLAKADAASPGPGQPVAESPTASLTATGTITGTAGYMSPEQVRGKRVDKRTDVWSFGCVLYECLSGKLAFSGDSAADRLSAVLERDPDWSLLPANTPPRILELLQRCLVKDPKARLRDLGDARLEIEAALAGKTWESGAQAGPVEHKRSLARHLTPWLPAAASAVAVVLGFWVWAKLHQPPPPEPIHLEMALPASAAVSGLWPWDRLAISPDGSTVVYEGAVNGGWQLCSRALGNSEVTPIPGTEDGVVPFFSPDGRWIGFFSNDQRLLKIPLEGGTATPVTDNCLTASARWMPDGIYFTSRLPSQGHPAHSIFRAPAAGGPPQLVLAPDEARGEIGVFAVSYLQANKVLLITVTRKDLKVLTEGLRLSEGRRIEILDDGGVSGYIPTGHLLRRKGDTLFAIPFDVSRLKVTGPPFPVLTGISARSVSRNGTLAWLPRSASVEAQSFLSWVDREGSSRPLTGNADSLWQPRISPDGRRIAVEREVKQKGLFSVWLCDLARGTFGLDLPNDPRAAAKGYLGESTPVWAPDGRRICCTSGRETPEGEEQDWVWVRPFEASGSPEMLLEGEECWIESFSPDGRYLTYGKKRVGQEAGYGVEIWLLPLSGGATPRPLVASPSYAARGSRVSPDGKWIAYFSDESGRFEVYVQAFPDLGRKVQVSTGGGIQPLWSADGREIFYLNREEVMAVPVKLSPSFEPGLPRLLFKGKLRQSLGESTWDMAPDGQHFVMVQQDESTLATKIHVVLNWFEEVKRKARKG